MKLADVEHYSMTIEWSDEDGSYIVTLPEFPGCHTHGDTREEALQHGQEGLQLIVEARKEAGRSLPQPRLFQTNDSEAEVTGGHEASEQKVQKVS
jgi:predicted RNase H-like HicB family nuclease